MMNHPTLFPINAPSTKRRYNWIPDKHDPRDLLFCKSAAPVRHLPAVVNLESLCSPVFDQGDIGSCTGNALAGLFEFEEMAMLRAHDIVSAAYPELFSLQYSQVSRLFIYYGERALEGTVGEDAGAEIRDGIKVLASKGVCREAIWAYAHHNLFHNPSVAAYTEAAKHRITQYSRLQSFQECKQSLASGKPVALGILVPESMESDEVATSGILPMPEGPLDQVNWVGGHAIMLVGYNDQTQRARIRNSWGTDWGQKGYFEVPYAFISNPQIASDMWNITR